MSFIIYSKPDCSFCIRAVAALTARKLPYEYKTLDEDFTREELLEKFPEAKTFPQIELSDGTYIGGYNELKKYID